MTIRWGLRYAYDADHVNSFSLGKIAPQRWAADWDRTGPEGSGLDGGRELGGIQGSAKGGGPVRETPSLVERGSNACRASL